MCYIHELVASNIATHCGAGEFDRVVNHVAYVATNRDRITGLSPDLTGVMGRDQAQMASEKVQNAYRETGMPQDHDALIAQRDTASRAARLYVTAVVAELGLTAAQLGLPVDPADDVKYGNRAVDAIFVKRDENDKPLTTFGMAGDLPEDHPAHLTQKAVKTLMDNSFVRTAFKTTFQCTAGALIVDAPNKLEAEQAATQTLKREFDCCGNDVTGQAAPELPAMPQIKRNQPN